MRLPKWVPSGHPHEWSVLQDSKYVEETTSLSFAQWTEIDDAVYARRHDVDCILCPVPVGEASVFAPYDEATWDVSAWLPPGNPTEWDVKTWVLLEEAEQKLSPVIRDSVDNEVLYRLGEINIPVVEGDSPTPTTKGYHEMTDAEWYEASLAIADAEKWTDYKEPVTVLPKSSAKCNCEGPGSASQKFTTHTQTCPAGPYRGKTSKVYGQHTWAKNCKHTRDDERFPLEDGLSIHAVAWRDEKYMQDDRIDIGVYLYNGWMPDVVVSPGLSLPWFPSSSTQGVYLNWPDYDTPDKDVFVVDIVKWMLAEIKAGKRFETACMGGHGRTGTMLAMLLVAQGVYPPDAVERVRSKYCVEAIEGSKQVKYVAEFYKMFHANESWRKSQTLRKRFNGLIKQDTKGWGSAGFFPSKNTGTKSKWDPATKKYVPAGQLKSPRGGEL